MFKKILTLLMPMTLILSITACGGSDINSSSGGGNSSASSDSGFSADLKSQIQNCTPIVDYAKNTSVDQMDTVTFGLDSYGEPIEWIVLEKRSDKALLLSKYLIGRYYYNEDMVDGITWENSDVRKWLNEDFINEIFSKKEQKLIIVSDVVNEDNVEWGGIGGNDTKDKLFLLSSEEVKKYFASEKQRVWEEPVSGSWWLRSPLFGHYHEKITYTGKIESDPLGPGGNAAGRGGQGEH